ncbi:uncharacterized protein IL334_004117 [Kwoniella shivajii]|uniref:Uncharacterized protein n=1 Tax=Kwoniella shivajii TaxID=564305 RepID=A0ABZ1CZF8_9TREE|nr:hypothetical protein IL334_004117 [Kwoniella shivajii]
MSPRPMRETRGSVKDEDTPGSKRKRQASTDIPLKFVLSSPSSLAKATSTSPQKTHGDSEHESKRQKLSLKLNVVSEKPKKIEEQAKGALDKTVRESLSVVIAQ